MERVLLGTVAGFLVVNAGLFTLASIGALYPLVVWPLAVLAALLSIKGHRPGSFVPTAGPSPEKKDRREPPRWAAVALGALLGLIFLGSLVESLYPSPYSAGSLAKHLAYPVIFAETRGYVFTPDNPLHFVYSGYWELLLTGVALFVRSEVTLLVMAQILHLILGLGGAALAISCLLRRLRLPGMGHMRLALATCSEIGAASPACDPKALRTHSVAEVSTCSLSGIPSNSSDLSLIGHDAAGRRHWRSVLGFLIGAGGKKAGDGWSPAMAGHATGRGVSRNQADDSENHRRCMDPWRSGSIEQDCFRERGYLARTSARSPDDLGRTSHGTGGRPVAHASIQDTARIALN